MSGSVNFTRGIGPLEVAEAEHLGEPAHEGPVDGLDLQAGVVEGVLDVVLVEPLGVRHLVVHPGAQRGRG